MEKKDISINEYNVILLDFDGVLAESMNVKTDAFAQIFSHYGDDVVKKVVKHHIENGGISRYKKIKYYYEKFLNIKISDDQLEKIAQEFSDIVIDKVIKSEWVKGAKEFLEKYYDKLDLYVISGTPQKEMEIIIKKRNMEKYFKGVFGTPDTKPILAQKIIKQNNYSKNNVLYVGDCLSDYHDAVEAKISFLGRVPKEEDSIFPKEVKTISDFFDVLK